VREGSWNESETIPMFEATGRSVAGVVGGLPIHLELLDTNGQPHKELLLK